MSQIIFSTNTFTSQEFTSAWIYLTDKNGQPCFGQIELTNKEIICNSSEDSFALNLLLEVEGFGKVMLQTSVVESQSKKNELLDTLISGRIQQIQNELIKSEVEVKVKNENKFEKLSKLPNSMNKLSELLKLGETIVLENSKVILQNKISKNQIKDFLIGGQAFDIDKGDLYKKIHQENFDMGIAPFYFFILKPDSREKTNWELTDKIVNWLHKSGRPIKGHPLLWFHIGGRPKWMEDMTFEDMKSFLREHIPQVINRYKDKIKMWDIVNEIPTADANSFNFTIDQLIELTKLVSKLVKQAQPEAERIINISDIFGPHSYIHEKPSIPPIHFLKLCQEKEVEYESIGLQFYMGMKKELACRELLNISQVIDEYAKFNKPIHFSELGWPSQHDVDPDCFFGADHPEVAGRWHRSWDEKLQAEFAEAIYTIFTSKPLAKSITWWDLTDNGKHENIGSRFIPFGGLTRRDFSEKPVLIFIQNFRKQIDCI